MLPTRCLALGLAAATLSACPAPTTLPVCPDDKQFYGDCVFLRADGRRQDGRDVVLNFQLRIKRNERFTATPEVETFLGEVVDAQTGGGTFQMTVRMPRAESQTADVLLRGTVSADFTEAMDTTRTLDRCQYEQKFRVEVTDGVAQESVKVTQDGECTVNNNCFCP